MYGVTVYFSRLVVLAHTVLVQTHRCMNPIVGEPHSWDYSPALQETPGAPSLTHLVLPVIFINL